MDMHRQRENKVNGSTNVHTGMHEQKPTLTRVDLRKVGEDFQDLAWSDHERHSIAQCSHLGANIPINHAFWIMLYASTYSSGSLARPFEERHLAKHAPRWQPCYLSLRMSTDRSIARSIDPPIGPSVFEGANVRWPCNTEPGLHLAKV